MALQVQSAQLWGSLETFSGGSQVKTISVIPYIICPFHYVHICTNGAKPVVGETARLVPLSTNQDSGHKL